MALVEVENLTKKFAVGRQLFLAPDEYNIALEDVSLSIQPGEVMGLVGESGSGKSTLARVLLHLVSPDAGQVSFDGDRVDDLSESKFRPYRRRIQAVFQDPRGSLNPRYRVRTSVEEGLRYLTELEAGERLDKVREILSQVGLGESVLDRYPHQLSGGQRQRVCIARALSLEPDFLICDEPTSALDVSIQAQIINLLLELRKKYNLTYLFISHNIKLVRYLSDRLAVMKDGGVVETGETTSVCENPRSKSTEKLLEAVF